MHFQEPHTFFKFSNLYLPVEVSRFIQTPRNFFANVKTLFSPQSACLSLLFFGERQNILYIVQTTSYANNEIVFHEGAKIYKARRKKYEITVNCEHSSDEFSLFKRGLLPVSHFSFSWQKKVFAQSHMCKTPV